MGTIADKLQYLLDTKSAIKEAITAKGVEVSDSDTFRSYADKIGDIQTGGGAGDVIDLGTFKTGLEDTIKIYGDSYFGYRGYELSIDFDPSKKYSVKIDFSNFMYHEIVQPAGVIEFILDTPDVQIGGVEEDQYIIGFTSRVSKLCNTMGNMDPYMAWGSSIYTYSIYTPTIVESDGKVYLYLCKYIREA